jgi:hypothetical protein
MSSSRITYLLAEIAQHWVWRWRIETGRPGEKRSSTGIEGVGADLGGCPPRRRPWVRLEKVTLNGDRL